MLNRLLCLLLSPIHHGEIKVISWVIGLELDCSLVVLNCFWIALKVAIYHTSVVVEDSNISIDDNSACYVCEGRLVSPLSRRIR